jgi:DNA-binding IclR family transcriptional regulator
MADRGSATPTRLSVQARRVLEALARTGDGQLTVREVLGHVRQPGISLAVTRASVSRTLRRLWRAGYVEVTDKHGITLTGHVAPIQRRAQAVVTAPALAYRAYLKQQATDDPCGSASAYATAYADYAARMPEMRVRTVTLAGAGHAAVNMRGG